MKSLAYVALAAALGLAANLAIAALAFGQPAEPQHAWIFVSNCDRVDVVKDAMAGAKQYANYTGAYDVVCFPSANDPLKVKQYVELVRTVYPTDKLVFTFDLRDAGTRLDFKAFLGTVDGFDHDGALGKAFISDGWGIADQGVAAHELAHLVTGKLHYSMADRDQPAAWVTSCGSGGIS